MANRRMIDTAFCQSEKVAKLSLAHRFLFTALIAHADDQGRMRAHPALIRSAVFPYDDISLDDIEAGLFAIESMGGIIVYVSAGKALLQIRKWWDYQKPRWAWPSDYPPPPDWADRLHYRKGNSAITQNWGSGVADTEPPVDGDPEVTPEWPTDIPTMETAEPIVANAEPIVETVRAGGSSTSTSTGGNDSGNGGDSGSGSKGLSSHNYLEIRQFWIDQFPDKPKPREDNATLRGKASTRMRAIHFQDNWRVALSRASKSAFLAESGWFTLSWFLKNDDHYEKCLNGNYDDTKAGRQAGTLNPMEVYAQVAQEEGWDDNDPQRHGTDPVDPGSVLPQAGVES